MTMAFHTVAELAEVGATPALDSVVREESARVLAPRADRAGTHAGGLQADDLCLGVRRASAGRAQSQYPTGRNDDRNVAGVIECAATEHPL
jgi:hypothetical protein